MFPNKLMFKHNEIIEQINFKGIVISLLAAGDGTEIIHHKLEQGAIWKLVPEDGWTALEFLWILSGTLEYKNDQENIYLTQGDRMAVQSLQDYMLFKAITEVEFIYITSQPIFHHYSKATRELRELTIQIEEKDGYTADHCQRITSLSMMIGNYLQMSSKEIVRLNMGAFFHDIGKLRIPIEILNKPGKLTKEEWEIMKTHTTLGREIVEQSQIHSLISAGPIIEQHHERYDGLGYMGLKGDEIELGAAIVSVVDSYDAITSNRPYQKARTHEEAIEEIVKWRGLMYHPDVVDAFLIIMENRKK